MTEFKHIVYWIYNTDKHTDPLTQGYIGVTAQPLQQRLSYHIRSMDNPRCDTGISAVSKHLKNENLDNIKIRPITRKISKDLAYRIEYLLRSETNIGWNGHRGGTIPAPRRPIIITTPDGLDKEYYSIASAARDGYNRGNLQQTLKGKLKTFHRGCTARYADEV